MRPSVVSLQIASASRMQVGERQVLSAFRKQAVHGPLTVLPLGLVGDEQADLCVHGGLDKALYAYPSEHYAFWQQTLHQSGSARAQSALTGGSLGENLTLSGLQESQVWVGDVLRFAHCELRVTQAREPCYKLNAALDFDLAARTMATSGFCGFYLAVQCGGTVQAGEQFELIAGPRRLGITEQFQAKRFKHLR